MGILEKLEQQQNFTQTEQVIANYLLDHRENLSHITIQELAQATYSSNATLIRFCKALGYAGFREFRVALVKELEASKYTVSTIDYTRPFRAAEPTETVVNRIYSLYKTTMDQAQSQLDLEVLEQMANCLMEADRIFLFGIGDAKLTLRSFMNKLIKINYFPVLATENSEERAISQHITKRDCALFVTYHANQPNYPACLELLKKNHVPILLLTANPDSDLFKASKLHILVPDLERSDKIATFYSQLTFEYLLNLIFALIYRRYERGLN